MADKMRRMVRKQLNIDPTHDDALKRLAAERNVSESEVVRQAIALFIEHEEADRIKGERAATALEELFAEWDSIPWSPASEGSRRFGIYDDLG
jgi:hypothetical protein